MPMVFWTVPFKLLFIYARLIEIQSERAGCGNIEKKNWLHLKNKILKGFKQKKKVSLFKKCHSSVMQLMRLVTS